MDGFWGWILGGIVGGVGKELGSFVVRELNNTTSALLGTSSRREELERLGLLLSKSAQTGQYSEHAEEIDTIISKVSAEDQQARDLFDAARRTVQSQILQNINGPNFGNVRGDVHFYQYFGGRAEPRIEDVASLRINNAPQRNPHFAGRRDLLGKLRKSLEKGDKTVLTAIHGIGGIGKTQIAIEYCHEQKGAYEVIWWIRAENPAQGRADFAGLEEDLKLPKAANQAEAIRSIKKWLELADPEKARWLLVFDNANSYDEIGDLIPAHPQNVIVTSRIKGWAQGTPINVDFMDEPDAVEFLTRRIERMKITEEEAKVLAATLGYLPLAMEQAAAYIEATEGLTVRGYLKLFNAEDVDITIFNELAARAVFYYDEEGEPEDETKRKIYKTVVTTWKLSFDQIKKENPAAIDILCLMSFLDPEQIEEEMFREWAAALPESLKEAIQNERAFNRVIQALTKYSMVRRAPLDPANTDGPCFLSMHRLIQCAIRAWMPDGDLKRNSLTTLTVLNEQFPGDIDTNVAAWPKCGQLLKHALAVARRGEELGHAPEETSRLMNLIAGYLQFVRADYRGAGSLFERLLAIDEESYGPNHPRVAIRVNNLGLALDALGDYSGAKAAFERALKIDEEAFGPNHPSVAIRVNNLGLVLQTLGDYVSAKAAFERALKIYEAAFGPNHTHVAICVNNLGLVLQTLGDYAGAKAAFERALKLDEAVFGLVHPQVATDVNNLGSVLYDIGDHAGAKAAFERALEISVDAFGPNHPQVATIANNLGEVLRGLGDYAGAKEKYESALKIDEAVFGLIHPQVATDMNNLGLALRELGDYAGAKVCWERTLMIQRLTKFPEDHPYIKITTQSLEILLQEHPELGDE